MKVADFDFPFDPKHIAQHPTQPRDAARLLDLSGDRPTHLTIGELPGLIQPEDLVIVNNTKVLPARLFGHRDAVAVEATLVRQEGEGTWAALARPGKRLKLGQTLHFDQGLSATIEAKGGAEVTLKFNQSGADLLAAIRTQGAMPLPPYIKRDRGGDAADLDLYQTPFAKHEGAVAAPTASLHFTDQVRAALPCPMAEVTLHVGLGTFAGISVEDTDDHVMHVEWGALPPETEVAIQACKARGGRVIAIGTTALRTLEAFQGQAQDGDINLFITPGYAFQVVDVLLTNFHLPASTLFMLVCAFAGTDKMKDAYALAQAENYRFFSYGDACWLQR